MAHEDWKAALKRMQVTPLDRGAPAHSAPKAEAPSGHVKGELDLPAGSSIGSGKREAGPDGLARERVSLEEAVARLRSEYSRIRELLEVTRADLAVAEHRRREVESEAENTRRGIYEQEAALEERLRGAARDLQRLATLDVREVALVARDERLVKDERALSVLETELSQQRVELQHQLASLASDRAALDRERAVLDESLEGHRRELARAWELEGVLAKREGRIEALSRELAEMTDREQAASGKSREAARRLRLESAALANAASLVDEERKGRKRAERAAERWKADAEALEARLADQASLTIADDNVLRWLAGLGSAKTLGLRERVGLVGSGPWQSTTLRRLLAKQGIRCCELPNKSVETVLVGREEWTERVLDEHLFDREGGGVRFYSFEMFLMFLATGADPFEGGQEVLLAFAKGHPALEFLKSNFDWPFTEASTQSLAELEFEGIDRSPLVLLGYHAGKTQGLSTGRRHQLLEAAIEGPLSWDDGHSTKYRAGWGTPSSRRRLSRVARHIAMLARQRATMHNQRYAVRDWAEDLHWLKTTYWKPAMGFRWPKVIVGDTREGWRSS